VTPAFFLGQDVDFGFELLVRFDGAGFRKDLAALDVVLVDAPQQRADIIARLPFVEQLAEHLHARHH
jgi:hypothetical protein